MFPSRQVQRAATPWLFKRAAEPAISYKFRSERRSIQDYLGHNPTTGLLIAKDDTILDEHYQYARTDRDRFLSQSMAKTITAMLIGIAVAENKIKSIDDPVSAYVPGLANTEYGGTSLRALLHMSSGVAFSENYDGPDESPGCRAICSVRPERIPSPASPSSTRARSAGNQMALRQRRDRDPGPGIARRMVSRLRTIFTAESGT